MSSSRPDGLAALTIAEARREIDAGRLSPVELTGAVLAAIKRENDGQRVALLSFTVPLNQLGTPVVVVPLGEREGLPFGMQVMGRRGGDAQLLALAAAYRRAAGQDEPVPVAPNG